MPDGGTLRIVTRRADFPDRSGRHWVALAISDTGSVIQDEPLPHVFEPFFTTKAVGKGTGLSLSQVYSFARASGGMADIASRIGHGTTVTVYLPLSTESTVARSSETGTPEPMARGSARIRVVVVGDNDEVRGGTAAFLEEAGFEVQQASHDGASLDLLEQQEVDVLIDDIIMPGEMDGLALAKQVSQRWPSLPIILVSGYSASASAAAELGFTLLMKPFQMTELADRIMNLAEGVGDASLLAK